MQPTDNPTRNGVTRNPEELAAELAEVKRQLEEVRRERDDYLHVVYGFLEKQWPTEIDDNEVLSHTGQRPTLQELIDELKKQG